MSVGNVDRLFFCRCCNADLNRAGYHSKIFYTDTWTSIPVPERYFFQYQFYEINFNKITLSHKNFDLFFPLADIYKN